ncbi:MAG: hypothetical protein PHY93_20445 [Bacteriovorax sp.]|nr:hypothetical protein [Bacteriovorax sp.]
MREPPVGHLNLEDCEFPASADGFDPLATYQNALAVLINVFKFQHSHMEMLGLI